jgi:hypothetical protein
MTVDKKVDLLLDKLIEETLAGKLLWDSYIDCGETVTYETDYYGIVVEIIEDTYEDGKEYTISLFDSESSRCFGALLYLNEELVQKLITAIPIPSYDEMDDAIERILEN